MHTLRISHLIAASFLLLAAADSRADFFNATHVPARGVEAALSTGMPANTVAVSDPLLDWEGALAGDDLTGQWRWRPHGVLGVANQGWYETDVSFPFPNNGDDPNPGDPPVDIDGEMLVTTLTGLEPGLEYEIYVDYLTDVRTTSAGMVNWTLLAGFDPGDMTPFGTVDGHIMGSYTTVGLDDPRVVDLGVDNGGNNHNYRALIGNMTADGSGEIDVYIDDTDHLAVAQSGTPGGPGVAGGNGRAAYDGLAFTPAGEPELTINRDDGSMTLQFAAARDIIGYSIRSASGALDQTNWTPIAGRLDSSVTGDGSVDDNEAWVVLTEPGVHGDLSEAELSLDGPLDGAQVPASTTINFGAVWTKHFDEDITIELLLNDGEGTIEVLPVNYIGNGDSPFPEGDFNFNGSIGAEDYEIFISNLSGTFGDSQAINYAKGDLNADGEVGYEDLLLFRELFDGMNGAGAFADMLAGNTAPEPGAIGLLLLSMVAAVFGFRGLVAGRVVTQRAAALLPLLLCAVAASSANAQTTYVDITETPGGNTTLLGGGDWQAVANNAADGLWRERSFGNGTIFETNAGGAEDGHMLETTITGLTANAEYYVYSYFWRNQTENWRMKATIDPTHIDDNGTPGDLTDDFLGNDPLYSYSANGSGTSTETPGAVASQFAAPEPLVFDPSASLVLEEASLGVATADALGQITVFIDDLENQGSGGTRTFIDGVGYEQVLPITLEVNTVTGVTRMINEAGAPIEFNYYEITSAMGSLNSGGWQSLDQQNIDAVDGDDPGTDAGDGVLEGWDAGGQANANEVAEVFYTGSSTLGTTDAYTLGSLFTPGGDEDLVLSFEIGGRLRTGTVEYVTSIPGDYDGNGMVEQADYTVWLNAYGGTNPAADGNGDGIVDSIDYAVWRENLGAPFGEVANSLAPEPTALGMVALGMLALASGRARRRLPALKAASSRGALLLGCLAVLIAASPDASAITLDRDFSFGEDSLEVNASSGDLIGSMNSPGLPAGDTADSMGPSGAFLDLTRGGEAAYIDVTATGINRPGAGAGDLGVSFDGVNDYLSGLPLNRPDELDALPEFESPNPDYPINYQGITARGLQAWVYPRQATLGTQRQAVIMDTIAAGGVAITADGFWTQINDGHADDDDIPIPAVPEAQVTGDTWHHVMHHVYQSGDNGAPKIVSGGSDLGFTGVLWVNGVAVSANNDSPNLGDSTGGSREGVLVVGAEELADPEASSEIAIIGNFFDGAVDNLQMYVYGDNSQLAGGADYGNFDLFRDNEWIAEQSAQVPGGMLQDGDLDRDGDVDIDDVNDFVDGWLNAKTLTGAHRTVTVGDWETWTWGDLDHDGQVYLNDLFLMHSAVQAQGLAVDLISLINGGGSVPEPTALLLLAAGVFWTPRRRA